ncbi:MAG: DUF2628 domain-containing protein [Proteobacteria bacterium]|nr:DUF2628 domain-containing protein [Pseudomonadota bacterium]MDA1021767.1 DUF2628 domain-containing protein [Pseudomonadota bacterium]
MRLYAVHLRRHGLDADRDVRLVKDGFSWPALFLTFLWALWHRLWWEAAAMLGASILLNMAAGYWGLDALSQLVVSLGLAILVGTLGNDLRAWKLQRSGFALSGVVTGKDSDHALRRFLDSEPALAADLAL